MHADIDIRPYEDAVDRLPVIALWRQVFDYTVAYKDPDFAIDAKLAVDNLFYVALDGGEVAGTVMVGYDGHRGWLYSLAVAPGLQRGGIGSALVRHAVEILRGLGCPKVNIQIHESNREVVGFYRANGFSVDAVVSMGKRLV